VEQLTAQASSSVILAFLFFVSMRACRCARLHPLSSSFFLCLLLSSFARVTSARLQLLVRSSISMQASYPAALNDIERRAMQSMLRPLLLVTS
jgi:hypothetical protein